MFAFRPLSLSKDYFILISILEIWKEWIHEKDRKRRQERILAVRPFIPFHHEKIPLTHKMAFKSD